MQHKEYSIPRLVQGERYSCANSLLANHQRDSARLFHWNNLLADPDKITHSWLEVKIDDQWRSIDTYINDLRLHNAAVNEIKKRGWKTGFSVSRAKGEPSADLILDEAHYSQMAAVIGDDGVWDEPAEFLNGPKYLNKVGPIRQWLYELFLPLVNARVRRLRDHESMVS